MNSKKEIILAKAVEMFAIDGYNATSTSKIANAANVSEGLIFRHFDNKEGLLKAILEDGRSKIEDIYMNVLENDHPESIIKNTIRLPFLVPKSQYNYWRLVYSLKWQANYYDSTVIDAITAKLEQAFTKLEYKEPALEARFIVSFIEGVAAAILLRNLKNLEGLQNLLLQKYNLD